MAKVVELAADLVRIPSQGGIDPPDAILAHIAAWFSDHRVPFRSLEDDKGRPLGLFVTVDGAESGPALCLDACVDTAPVGDPNRWRLPPFGGIVEAGMLHGRGAADSKLGAAILMHLAELFTREPPKSGKLYILFDADEHTGGFGGVKAFLEAAPTQPIAMVLGYPGHESIVRGARGFLRCEIEVSGIAAHSGSINRRGVNAISKAARLVAALEAVAIPDEGNFPLPPASTITRFCGGEGFSQVPDRALIGVDLRLTPDFCQNAAKEWLKAVIARFDAEQGDGLSSTLRPLESWPAYEIDASHPLVRSFRVAGERAFRVAIDTQLCGPSNIGNLLSTHNIATICGVGAHYAHLHATDERVRVSDINSVIRAWELGTRSYLA